MREIIPNDIKKLKELSRRLFEEEHLHSVERLGGMTNHSYRVQIQDQDLVFRIPGEGTEQIINRQHEIIANKLASKLDIDTRILYIDEAGVKITPYIPDAKTMNAITMRQPANIQLAADVLNKLHHCQVDTHILFDITATAKEYEKCIQQHEIAFFDDYAHYREVYLQLKKAFALPDDKLVPCHNDPLPENWVLSQERMYLIDWEYAGMNDPLWDLADLSIEANFNHKEDTQLLCHYTKSVPDASIWQRFYANKVFIDYLWSLWGLARIPYDPSMYQYGLMRYERMKENLHLLVQA